MHQSVIATLCYEIPGNPAFWSGHFVKNLFKHDEHRPTRADVRHVLCDDDPEVIEDYPHDPRGRSCLIWGIVRDRPLHVVGAYPPSSRVITAYWPDTEPDEWTDDYKRRARGTS
jgi:hypothetical protein